MHGPSRASTQLNIGRDRLRFVLTVLRGASGKMTPQQEPLSGVIICPVLKQGTAVKGELLHHNQQFNYTPEGIFLSNNDLPADIELDLNS